jgi:hypothetical protein
LLKESTPRVGECAGRVNPHRRCVVVQPKSLSVSFMLSRIAFVAAVVAASVSSGAAAAPPSAGHAAACVAALKAEETTLADALKADAALEPELLKVVRSGIAIIGTQYLAGLREAEARQLLQDAERDFQSLPPQAAEERQATCLIEGDALYTRASPLERSLITSAAQRRIRRLKAA